MIGFLRGKPAHFVRLVEAKGGIQGPASIRGMEHDPVRADCRCPFHHYTHERPCDSLTSAITLSVYVDDQRHGRDLDARPIMRHPRELRLDVHSRARDYLSVITDRKPPSPNQGILSAHFCGNFGAR